MDLTLADNKMLSLVKGWHCNEQESFYDHRIITFRVQKHRRATRKCTHHGMRYVTSEECYKEFEKNFFAEIRHNFALAGFGSLDDDICTGIALDKDIKLTTKNIKTPWPQPAENPFKYEQEGKQR